MNFWFITFSTRLCSINIHRLGYFLRLNDRIDTIHDGNINVSITEGPHEVGPVSVADLVCQPNLGSSIDTIKINYIKLFRILTLIQQAKVT